MRWWQRMAVARGWVVQLRDSLGVVAMMAPNLWQVTVAPRLRLLRRQLPTLE